MDGHQSIRNHPGCLRRTHRFIQWLGHVNGPLFHVFLMLVLAPGTTLVAQKTSLSVRPTAGIVPPFAAQSDEFVFAAGGDIGANSASDASLRAIPPTGASFFLALGDMDYDETPSDAAWCTYVKERVGNTFPFEIVTGNHEEGSANNPGPDGYIGNHAACLPDYFDSNPVIAGKPGYPANYYFDYPQPNPIMRVIMISANLTYDGIEYNFNMSEQTNYNALAAKIDEAQETGMWVVMGIHKVCLTVGDKPCEIGADLMNLLIQKKVDLVLHGHDHNYQRSKQIALGSSCTSVVPEAYNTNCIVDDGSDNLYTKGAGTVFVINGNVGRCCYDVQASDNEAGYFAKMIGEEGVDRHGFVVYTVSPSRIDAQVINSVGNWSDSFSVVGDEPEPPPPVPIEPGTTTTNNPPTFIWNPVAGATGYEIQYGDADPPSITVSNPTTNFTPSMPLLIKTYYWRVRAKFNGSVYSGWSLIRTVSIETVTAAAPSRHYYATAPPRLTWGRISWATQYEIQVDTSTAFTPPLSYQTQVASNTLRLTITGLTDGWYYWRVRARRGDGTWAAWSAVDRFIFDAQ
jgi:hypothetical protein